MVHRVAVLFVTAGCWIASMAFPALASCASDPNITFGDHMNRAVAVFVGTVEDTSNQERTAKVKVLEVWRGGDLEAEGDLPSTVTVNGTPLLESGESIDPNVFTSVDRRYKTGVTLLFLPDGGGRTGDEVTFGESACSATTEFTTEVAAYRPPGVRPVALITPRSSVRSQGSWVPMAVVIAAASLGAGYALLRSRNPNRSTKPVI